MAHYSFQTDGGFDSVTFAKLTSIVARRSSNLLNGAEVDDIVLKIVGDATLTASKPGSTQSVATIAFAYARRSDYYARARIQAEDLRQMMTAAARDNYAEKPSPENIEHRMAVRAVLRTLPNHLARVLWLCDGEGYTLAEVAAMLGVSTSTVARYRTAARDRKSVV